MAEMGIKTDAPLFKSVSSNETRVGNDGYATSKAFSEPQGEVGDGRAYGEAIDELKCKRMMNR